MLYFLTRPTPHDRTVACDALAWFGIDDAPLITIDRIATALRVLAKRVARSSSPRTPRQDRLIREAREKLRGELVKAGVAPNVAPHLELRMAGRIK
jgi:hypothetical protein